MIILRDFLGFCIIFWYSAKHRLTSQSSNLGHLDAKAWLILRIRIHHFHPENGFNWLSAATSLVKRRKHALNQLALFCDSWDTEPRPQNLTSNVVWAKGWVRIDLRKICDHLEGEMKSEGELWCQTAAHLNLVPRIICHSPSHSNKAEISNFSKLFLPLTMSNRRGDTWTPTREVLRRHDL